MAEADAPLPEGERRALIAEVAAISDRIAAAEVLHIARTPDGRVVWLDRTGLRTLLQPDRIAEFLADGFLADELPGLPVRALATGRRIGRVDAGEVYGLRVHGLHLLVVSVEADGRIADARPRRPGERLLPWDAHSPLRVAVRLESDWGSSPFWVQEYEDGPFEVTDEETFRRMFDVPDEAMAAVQAWDRLYLDHLNWDDPAATQWEPGAEERHRELGRTAVRLLQQHLPDGAAVYLDS